jgi:mRNA interferase MazF
VSNKKKGDDLMGTKADINLHRYDIVEAEINYGSGSIQRHKRPYIVVSNELGTTRATIVTLMPLTTCTKKKDLPVHGCLETNNDNRLKTFSMVLGEQPLTVDKREVIRKIGNVKDKNQRNIINKICYNTFFFGENIDWNEVLND